MHGSPPCSITVARFAAWRVAVAVAALAALATLAAWLWGSPLGEHGAVRLGVALAALVIAGLAASLWRQPPVRLRWDGASWAMAAAEGPEVPGRLDVAIDLGSFLLLRFHSAAGSAAARSRWIPVQRPGLERDWHVLRCAVHSPAAGEASAPRPR